MKKIHLLAVFIAVNGIMAAQNAGIGTTTPASKLHIKGTADTTQLIIEANTTQSNTHPLIKLRNSSGTDLMWIHSDDTTNCFTGRNAGRVNNTAGGFGAKNSFIGSNAGYSNTTGSANSAFGFGSLYSNTTGNYNAAIGFDALALNTIGLGNSAIGSFALHANTTGTYNAATGYQSLYSNTSGSDITAFGAATLYNNTTGNTNTATGASALYSNTIGYENTACGVSALYNNNTGFRNSAFGELALQNNVTGNFNTAIGFNAGTSGSYDNTVSIGNNGWLNGFSNQAFIGNASTGWIGGWVGWSVYSDARMKTNVTEDVKGLDFITRLRPVTYYRSIKLATQLSGNKEMEDYPEKYDVEKIQYSGFLAQEVEKAAQACGYNFSGITKPRKETDLYSLCYESFVVPLVKAVQEQQKMIVDMKKEMEELKKLIKDGK